MKNQTKIAAAKNKQNAHTPTTDKGQKRRALSRLGMRHMEIGNGAGQRRAGAREQGRGGAMCCVQYKYVLQTFIARHSKEERRL